MIVCTCSTPRLNKPLLSGHFPPAQRHPRCQGTIPFLLVHLYVSISAGECFRHPLNFRRCSVIQAAYSFIGTEIVALTAGEAAK